VAIGRKPPAAGQGRKSGVPNKATLEVKEFCRGLINDEIYQKKLRARMQSGKIPPAVEALMWHYAYGKPTETVEVQTPPDGLTIKHVFTVAAQP
jgi:adenine C2-methylase RlmN of 23S rRNA A2503 and tRNA A37